MCHSFSSIYSIFVCAAAFQELWYFLSVLQFLFASLCRVKLPTNILKNNMMREALLSLKVNVRIYILNLCYKEKKTLGEPEWILIKKNSFILSKFVCKTF